MKDRILFVVAISALLATGCTTPNPNSSPVLGLIYTDVKAPSGEVVISEKEDSPKKMGTAMCKTWFGLVATGDCSLEAAMKNGGITKVTHVDHDAYAVIIVYGTYTTTVYGY